MAIFISYSRINSDFVDKLAVNLIQRKANIWVDRWEVKVGESLTDKIQNAIKSANAILIVFSKAFLQSEWCKRELSASLIRELEEKKVLILPLLIEDCEIPVFLKDKLYADFRENFDIGLKTLLHSIAGITSDSLGRVESPDFVHDWGFDWDSSESSLNLEIAIISFSQDKTCSILTTINITGNYNAALRFNKFKAAGFEWFARTVILQLIGDSIKDHELRILIEDNFRKRIDFKAGDSKQSIIYEVNVSIRRLGQDTGNDILFNFDSTFLSIAHQISQRNRMLNSEESARLYNLLQ